MRRVGRLARVYDNRVDLAALELGSLRAVEMTLGRVGEIVHHKIRFAVVRLRHVHSFILGF